MLKIRLTRRGKKHQPSYRIVVAEARSKRNGKYLDLLGFYHPLSQKNKFFLDKEKYQLWRQKGAIPTKTILQLLKLSDGKTH